MEAPFRSIASRAKALPSTSTSDRKSTRLNSSHSQISYAVFCLKKKNSETMNYDDIIVLCLCPIVDIHSLTYSPLHDNLVVPAFHHEGVLRHNVAYNTCVHCDHY